VDQNTVEIETPALGLGFATKFDLALMSNA
jgi:hypothetical protein